MVRLTLLAGVIASLPLIYGHPSELVSRDDRGGCIADVPTEEYLAAASAMSAEASSSISSFSTADFSTSAIDFGTPTYDIIVKTWMHVVAASTALEDGYIPEQQLLDQMDVLNDNFGEFFIIPQFKRRS
jgi:hypothetical protein